MKPVDIEKYVLWSLDHTGWYPDLWFPNIQRDHLNFPEGPSDADVHSALFRLIANGAVVASRADGAAIAAPAQITPEMLQQIGADRAPIYELILGKEAQRRLRAALDRSRIPPRGYFELFALGEEFDVDAYLRTAPLAFDNVWRRQEGGRPTSGIGLRLGDGAELSLMDQQKLAVQFLATNRDALRELAQHPGVTTFTLGLQYNIELTEGLLGFCMSPTAKLMYQALDIGLRPTFYVVLKRPDVMDHGFSLETFLGDWWDSQPD
jgi:hypothetical protein